MLNKKNNPIGVFDSGLGGLTVVKELMRHLPSEDIIYYGDTARVPYGTKSKESIIQFSMENTKVLLKHKVKMIVVACNSSSSYALKALNRKFHVPIVGVIHSGVKKAITLTKNRKVGVVATSATIESGEYNRTVKRFNSKIKVFSKACPLFVPLAEEGWTQKPIVLDIAKEYLSGLKKANVDTLILGCTHYPLLKSVLQRAMGKRVVLVDSAKEVARDVKQLLGEMQVNNNCKRKARYKFLISDRPQEFNRIAKRFLGKSIRVVSHRS